MSGRRRSSISSTAEDTKSCSATSSAAANSKGWTFNQSSLYPRFPRRQPDLSLHALGQSRRATSSAGSGPAISWAKAMRRSFRELMETTDWDHYGTGKYEKCANCMVHCGYEATAVTDTITHPLKALGVHAQGRPHRRRDGAGDLLRQRSGPRHTSSRSRSKSYLDQLPAEEKERKRKTSSAA